MNLTKTDFKEYLICPKWFWIKKKKPELYIQGETSLFLEKLIKDGYEVEEYSQKLFPGGIEVTGDKTSLISKTSDLLKEHKTMFQATLQTEDGLFAKVDVLDFNNETQKWDLYEIKASSDIKTDLQHNHLKDITFQTITVEEAGVSVGNSYIIHINKEYRRNGDINPRELFVIKDVTKEVKADKENVRLEIKEAISLLKKDDISFNGCDCLYRSHGQRCDAFELFNPKVPKYSVHNIVSGKKLQSLLDDEILDVKDIPDDFELTDIQRGKVVLQKLGKPLIDTDSIRETLSNLIFPLYFLDYETFGKPYPILDGYTSNQQIVFQVSLHVVTETGELKHFEYLGEELQTATAGLLKMMQENIGPVGSIIVWNEGFEKGRNQELMEIHPEYRNFLEDMNNRIYDLMLVFKKDYLHPDFFGSASIKKVLPVLLPELSYKNLEIQDGTMALSEWERSIKDDISLEERENIRENLLEYCKLDTLAMVEIWKVLKNVVD
jgi:CRISPR/Cas system-associated exonuclease Cas4 (RecB family)